MPNSATYAQLGMSSASGSAQRTSAKHGNEALLQPEEGSALDW
jgi:hypothetical protein